MKIAMIETLQVGDINHVSDNIFFSGCNNHCVYCHNKWLKDFRLYVDYDISKIIETCHSDWVTLMGGEPLHRDVNDLVFIIKELKNAEKKIVIFTSVFNQIIYDLVDHYHLHIVDDMSELEEPIGLKKLSFAFVSYKTDVKDFDKFPKWAINYPVYVRLALGYEKYSNPEKDAQFMKNVLGYKTVLHEGEKVVVNSV